MSHQMVKLIILSQYLVCDVNFCIFKFQFIFYSWLQEKHLYLYSHWVFLIGILSLIIFLPFTDCHSSCQGCLTSVYNLINLLLRKFEIFSRARKNLKVMYPPALIVFVDQCLAYYPFPTMCNICWVLNAFLLFVTFHWRHREFRARKAQFTGLIIVSSEIL